MRNLIFRLSSFFLISYASAQDQMPQQVKRCQIENYEQCFFSHVPDPSSILFRSTSQAFSLLHEQPTGQSAVLVHGLTDSPYIMKDLASVLYEQGYDVYAILLAGHGTRPADLFQVTKEDWQAQLREAVELMAPRSKTGKVLLAGFSMGGALITAEALQRPEAYSGLIYLAPALRIADPLTPASCVARYVTKWLSQEPEKTPWRYNSLPTNAVCQLYKLTEDIKDRSNTIQIPIWSALSTGDKRIDIPEVLSFIQKAKNPKNISRVIDNPEIQHADLPLHFNPFSNRSNPEFQTMKSDLIEFLKNLDELN